MTYKIWKITIEPKSSFVTPLQSDTLFGSMIWSLKILFGNEVAEKAVADTKNYNPPFIFSNAIINNQFPIFGKLSEEFYRKIDNEILNGYDVEKIEFYKVIRKKSTVDKKVFGELLNGVKLEQMYFDVLEGKRKLSTLEKTDKKISEGQYRKFLKEMFKENKEEDSVNRLFVKTSRLRNSINRLGKLDEVENDTRLFEQTEIEYGKETKITIYVKINEEFNMDYFEKALEYIELNGYGGKSSIGKGQFKIIEFKEEKDFEASKNSNEFVVLSNYIPNIEDKVKVLNSNIFTKKPKAYMTENPFKDYFICYKEGSYFEGNSENIKGRVLDNLKKDDKKNIQCLIPFVLGVKNQ
ncbi:hypothetical protein EII29_04210 [Leptotrichia sp. OH3620_COT-345]|uniref:type III-A CRISPR-associated RAMP protein Csm4 n=1 Tax=Leptotrichia sp. OH3620_COT-345 TaxID=2491048 RepID=UPI000F646B59|nr:hypothetical protein [Leptotrichia sp. OH3620_COT-345]RRD40019.1 hypothetical protein EII29_04210 [Leptotrichia sp. OH3620_COT-345]